MDEDQGVEREEGGGAQWVGAAPGGDPGDQHRQSEHRERRHRLQHGDREADREPGQRVSEEGEQRAIGAGRFGPGDVGEGRVRWHRVGRVDVGVEAVDEAEAGVVDVAEDVVGEQHRCQGECGDEKDDRDPDDPRPERRGGEQKAEVGEEAGPDEGVGESRVDLGYPLPPADLPVPTSLSGSGGGSGAASCPAPGA